MHHPAKKTIIVFVLLLVIVIAGVVQSQGWWLDAYTFAQQRFYAATAPPPPAVPIPSRVVQAAVHSDLFQADRNLTVYLPAAYDQNQQQRFPVLYLLHGDPGDNNDWLINTHLQTVLDEKISNGTLPPLIVVLPDGEGDTVKDSQWVDATTTATQPMASYVGIELVHYIDSQYRTIANRDSRAIGGVSSGGLGAVNIGLKHQDEFSLILSYSGYFSFTHEKASGLLKTAADQTAFTPLAYAKNIDYQSPLFMYFSYEDHDYDFIKKDTQAFAAVIATKPITAELHVENGWHVWPYWETAFENSLPFIAAHLVTAGSLPK